MHGCPLIAATYWPEGGSAVPEQEDTTEFEPVVDMVPSTQAVETY